MFSEQEVVKFVRNIHEMKKQAQVMRESGMCHIIGLPEQVQVYEGIQQVAKVYGQKAIVRRDTKEPGYYEYRAEVEVEGIVFFQLGNSPEEAMKGVEKFVESEV